jgi:hypothetical protein
MKFTIRHHVPRIGADYEFASVTMYNNIEKVRYGDYYHEKGSDRCKGWIDGFAAALGLTEFEVAYEEFHDPECYDYEEECEVCDGTGQYFRATLTGGTEGLCWKCNDR